METQIENPTVNIDLRREQARQRVASLALDFVPIANRAERSRVQTKKGREIFDGDLRDAYNEVAGPMDAALEILFDTLPEDEKTSESGLTEVSAARQISSDVDKPNYTTLRVQLSTEPVPEGFSGGLVEINPNYKDGRKYDL